MCWTRQSLRFPFGGTPNFQRLSFQAFAAPVAYVEGRIGKDIVEFQIRESVVVEGVSMGDLSVYSPNGKVHPGKSPRCVVQLLTIDGDIGPCLSAVSVAVWWARMNSTDCTNMPDDPQHGS